MKLMWMMIFFVLPVVGLAYVLWHIWQLLPFANPWRWAAVAVALLLFLTMFLGFSGAIERMPLNVATAVYETGNSVIFILLYLVMLFLLLDIGRFVHLVPHSWLLSNGFTSVGVLVVMTAIFVYGNIHYNHKERVPLEISIRKNIGVKSLKIVLLSDLHLGYHNRRAEFHKWVDRINVEHADLILVGGDIIDISVRPLIEERVADEFRRLNAPVYACLGNHEYYSGEPLARQFYKDAGITLLRDSVAKALGISIIGRDDRTNVRRRPLSELMRGIDRNRDFTILLDHQPYHLEEAERNGVDFQFSGHTHHGQVWPASWITDAIYEDAFGPLTKGATQYYVSSGMGIWGGKFRIGTRSEYVVLTVRANSLFTRSFACTSGSSSPRME